MNESDDRLILEGLVTTQDRAGRLNWAPMGPSFAATDWQTADEFELRPFNDSKTGQNLRAVPEGVFHVTDNVLDLARAVLGQSAPALAPSVIVQPPRLMDCCRWLEFRVVDVDDSQTRLRMKAQVLHRGSVRDFCGLNRAKHAVVELAILATRLHLLSAEHVTAEIDRLRPLIDKTGGQAEVAAFGLLTDFIGNASRRSTSG